jgi:hypothetical protein
VVQLSKHTSQIYTLQYKTTTKIYVHMCNTLLNCIHTTLIKGKKHSNIRKVTVLHCINSSVNEEYIHKDSTHRNCDQPEPIIHKELTQQLDQMRALFYFSILTTITKSDNNIFTLMYLGYIQMLTISLTT